MAYKYTVNNLKDNMARALGKDLPISFKQSIEICNFVRGNNLSKAKEKLNSALDKEKAIPFKRFTNGLGHKKGMASGRYPQKASKFILKLLESAEANALYKGLNSKGLSITHISAKQSPDAWHYGRKFRRKMKRCHIEVVLEEQKHDDRKSKLENKTESKTENKAETTTQTNSAKKEDKQQDAKNKVQSKPEMTKIQLPEKSTESKTIIKKEDKTTDNKSATDSKSEIPKSAKAVKGSDDNKTNKPDTITNGNKQNTSPDKSNAKPNVITDNEKK